MRSDTEQHSYRRGPVSIYLDDDATQSHRLPEAGVETERPPRRASSAGRDGDNPETCERAARFSCIMSLSRGLSDSSAYSFKSGRRARGSRSFVVAVEGRVTKGPPSIGAAWENATSGISLGLPSSGKSLRKRKNGSPSHIRLRRRPGRFVNLTPIMPQISVSFQFAGGQIS